MCEERLEDVEAEELRGVSPAHRRHRTGASTTNRRGLNRATTDEAERHPKGKLAELRGKGKSRYPLPSSDWRLLIGERAKSAIRNLNRQSSMTIDNRQS